VDIAAEKTGDIFGILGTKMAATKSVSELKVEEYDFLIIPGGVKAMEKLRLDKKSGGNLSSSGMSKRSHRVYLQRSPDADHPRGLRKARKITGYYSMQVDIEKSGRFLSSPFCDDGNIVTSPHYKYMGSWMKEALRVYYSQS